MLWLKICSTDHNEILPTSWQCYCHAVCKILFWLAEYIMNKSITKFHWISNSIEISLVGWTPGLIISWLIIRGYLIHDNNDNTENKRLSIWQLCHYWWHCKLSFWQLAVPPVMTKLSNWLLFFQWMFEQRSGFVIIRHPILSLLWKFVRILMVLQYNLTVYVNQKAKRY